MTIDEMRQRIESELMNEDETTGLIQVIRGFLIAGSVLFVASGITLAIVSL